MLPCVVTQPLSFMRQRLNIAYITQFPSCQEKSVLLRGPPAARARQLVAKYRDNSGAGARGLNGCRPAHPTFDSYIVKALAEQLAGTEVFRITLTVFLDVYTFNVRRVMKCCLAHLLPSRLWCRS